MSLLTYQNARPWARAIKRMVVERRMPPWLADPHYSSFSNDRRLTDKEIQTIAAWVDGGAKEGNPADMPAPPQFADGWQIGVPDLVLTMKEPLHDSRDRHHSVGRHAFRGLRLSGRRLGSGHRNPAGQSRRRASRRGAGQLEHAGREPASLFAGPGRHDLARRLRQAHSQRDDHLISDALQRDRQGDDRPDQGRIRVREEAGAHAGAHDDHLQHVDRHSADGEQLRSRRGLQVQWCRADSRLPSAHAPAGTDRHRVVDLSPMPGAASCCTFPDGTTRGRTTTSWTSR